MIMKKNTGSLGTRLYESSIQNYIYFIEYKLWFVEQIINYIMNMSAGD